MKIAQVGSSVHGKLLQPNDIDIAIELGNFTRLELFIAFLLGDRTFQFKQGFKSIKIWKFNFLFLFKVSLLEYVNSFDMNILKFYKTLISRKLIPLNIDAIKSLTNREIIQKKRGLQWLFEKYDKLKENEMIKDRYFKYKEKANNAGFKFKSLVFKERSAGL